MASERTYTASKTRSKRPGWSVTFTHPLRRDERGKYGRKVRRGLGTTDAEEADRLVEQVNELLADRSWWDVGRRYEAERSFDRVAVAAFFDGMELGKVSSIDLRERAIPLPTHEEDYAHVMLVGATGAGKTTLLRHLIGADHKSDRFPSTSTAKTTTADIEIVLAPGPFEAVITFMSQHEARAAVDECIEQACGSVVRGRDETGIAESLLEHPEQRFRLSYPLGRWMQEGPAEGSDDLFADEDSATALPVEESVDSDARRRNNQRLRGYVTAISEIAKAVEDEIASEHRLYSEMESPARRQEWLEVFGDALHENEDFVRVSRDIMQDIQERFALISDGAFAPAAGQWPMTWILTEADRDVFLKHVRWFTSNHHEQFGRLLTPLVDGIRVKGPFAPAVSELRDEEWRLVLVDGEGLGHSAREVTSVSTRITERFPKVDMILLVDNAESPMQAAPLELLRAAGRGGHGNKIGVAFTHVDQVKGDNLRNLDQRRDHIRASTRNAVNSLRETEGAPVAEILERRLENGAFFLGALDRSTSALPQQIIDEMLRLLGQMQASSERIAQGDAAPTYRSAGLALALRDAADGFKRPWEVLLGLRYEDGARREHWARIKALCRRIAHFGQNEYNDLRPVADLVSHLQRAVSLWLDEPESWTREPTDSERDEVIDRIRREVFQRMHSFADERLVDSHLREWDRAYLFRGRGSSRERAREVNGIYDEAAPAITSARDVDAEEFLQEVIDIVNDSVIEAGGEVTT
ncbi:MAG: hypothetical protein OXE43_13060 [Chloroflexi bacterium]|nr:hypothetical protein [Chloroflexota bacterium]